MRSHYGNSHEIYDNLLVKNIDYNTAEKTTLKESSEETTAISSNEISAENCFDQSELITVQEDMSLLKGSEEQPARNSNLFSCR